MSITVSQDNGRVFVISGDRYMDFSPEEAEEVARGLVLKAGEARAAAEEGDEGRRVM